MINPLDLNDPDFRSKLGWIPHAERSVSETQINSSLLAAMNPFKLSGTSAKARDGKALLWDNARKVNGRKDFYCFLQLEGSCVGEGKAKAEWYVAAQEIARGEPEKLIMPYMPYGYGMSRFCAGISSRSHGSTGTGAAEAARLYGVLSSQIAGLKPWQIKDQTLVWGSELESMWMNKVPDQYIQIAKKNLIKTTALVRSSDDLRDGLINGFAGTCASSWGGLMQCPEVEGVLLNRHADTWPHQMQIPGWMDHLVLGEIFYIQNSWGQNAHGTCPTGAPLGGFWIKKYDMQQIIDEGETFLYSQFDGFPADQIPWIF